MNDLPEGWLSTRLGEVAEVRLGRQRSPRTHTGSNMRPYLRAANVTWQGLDLADVKEMHFSPAEVETYRLKPGDVLVAEASGSKNEVGKPALWRGELDECCFQNTLLRVRTRGPLPQYLFYYLSLEALSGRLGDAARGVGIHHIGAAGLSTYRVPLAPLEEQHRIIAAIEELFSRLDAAEGALRSAEKRSETFDWRVLRVALEQEGDWPEVAVREIAHLSLGKMLDKKQQTGLHPTRYLRNINVRWGTFALDDVATMDVPPREFDRASVRNGDLVMCEGGEPGRCAVWRGDEPIAIQKALHRIRPTDGVLPDFLLILFRQMTRSGELASHFTGTTIKHLPKERLAEITLRLPPLSAQMRSVEQAQSLQFASSRLAGELGVVRRRGAALRRSILAAAFSGRLVAHARKDGSASVLLSSNPHGVIDHDFREA